MVEIVQCGGNCAPSVDRTWNVMHHCFDQLGLSLGIWRTGTLLLRNRSWRGLGSGMDVDQPCVRNNERLSCGFFRKCQVGKDRGPATRQNSNE